MTDAALQQAVIANAYSIRLESSSSAPMAYMKIPERIIVSPKNLHDISFVPSWSAIVTYVCGLLCEAHSRSMLQPYRPAQM